MAAPYSTLALDPATWDLRLDAAGNIAINAGPAALAQDVASAVRTFLGECWYNTALGVPYFQQILGYSPSLQFMKAAFVAAGMTVPGVASIVCYLVGIGPSRKLGGQLQITSTTGALVLAGTSDFQGGVPWYVNAAAGGAET